MGQQFKSNLPSCVARAGREERHMIGAAVGPGCSHAPIPIDGAMTHDFIRLWAGARTTRPNNGSPNGHR